MKRNNLGWRANRRKRRSSPRDFLPLLVLASIIAWTGFGASNLPLEAKTSPGEPQEATVSVIEPLPAPYVVNLSPSPTLEERIQTLARAHGVEPQTALNIARCESSLDPSAQNPSSSARGLYQFTDQTWVYIGSPGDRLVAEDSILAFLKWYPLHPEWWDQCSVTPS